MLSADCRVLVWVLTGHSIRSLRPAYGSHRKFKLDFKLFREQSLGIQFEPASVPG